MIWFNSSAWSARRLRSLGIVRTGAKICGSDPMPATIVDGFSIGIARVVLKENRHARKRAVPGKADDEARWLPRDCRRCYK